MKRRLQPLLRRYERRFWVWLNTTSRRQLERATINRFKYRVDVEVAASRLAATRRQDHLRRELEKFMKEVPPDV